MKKIIGFVAGTVVVLALALGVQMSATSTDQDKRPPVATNESTLAPTDESTEPSPGPSTGDKADDTEQEGATEDHTGKPGENK